MTLERSVINTAVAGKKHPSHSHLPEWQAFSFASGQFLLHIPSSHVLEVPGYLVAQVRGEVNDPAAAAELDGLAQALPRPVKKKPELDIRAISLNMAQGCNLRCTYCFAGEGDYGSKGMMSFATAKAAISLLAQGKSSFHVVFFGGEPMLNFAVMEQVVNWCEAEQLPITFSMTTNGTLLTAEKMAWLKAKKFALNLSYDGPGMHAKQRLNKDRATNSEALVERKIAAFSTQLAALRDVRLRATVTKATLPYAEEALLATLNSKNFKVFLSHHATSERGVEFGDDDITYLGDVLRRIVDRFIAAGDFARLLKLENIEQAVRMIHRGKTGGMTCGAGVNYLTVSVSGGFYLCHRFNEDESERVGGITDGLSYDKLAEVSAFRSAGKAPCNTCWMREWCAGGCMHEHKSASGDKFAIDPRFCRLQAIEMIEAMRVYTTILARDPALLESI
ncbi:MAG: radical SAM protein [Deltaproteobacteria bacterium]|nr:radical SAM protein [Deltaproteobacteria bacterium]